MKMVMVDTNVLTWVIKEKANESQKQKIEDAKRLLSALDK